MVAHRQDCRWGRWLDIREFPTADHIPTTLLGRRQIFVEEMTILDNSSLRKSLSSLEVHMAKELAPGAQ